MVDEEQRFGVKHKETLKALRTNVDVLSMSATPIPRTLEMAISGIREMSVLQTPPEERQPVLYLWDHTERPGRRGSVGNYWWTARSSSFTTESIRSIRSRQDFRSWCRKPGFRVAHGKLSEAELEKTIIDFWNHEFDVLVSTTIIETGLDISNANTLIIDRADTFGLSQLHQLRGRVGRGRSGRMPTSSTAPTRSLSETALERLRTIASNTDRGAARHRTKGPGDPRGRKPVGWRAVGPH